MLIHEPMALEFDLISEMIGNINGNTNPPEEILTGIYERPDFGSSAFMPGYKGYIADNEKRLRINSYGVCDNVLQILDLCPEIETDKSREFIITVTPGLKKNQHHEGGWRWHKWGPYIGTKTPQCEYLYDEPDIDGAFVYHIYEKEVK